MSETVSRTVSIVNRQGLHARPCMQLVKAAHKFQSDVRVTINGETVNCKSIMEVMTLASPLGTELKFDATGADAPAAIDALVAIVAAGFGEELGS